MDELDLTDPIFISVDMITMPLTTLAILQEKERR